MTENRMTGRPYGGVNERPEEDALPGEEPLRGDEREVRVDPEQSPRAARDGGRMGEDQAQGVPGSGTSPNSAGPPNAGRP